MSIQYTDPGLVQDVFVRGHEIATHTVNHVSNPDVNEIVGAKRWLNQTAKIPMEAIQGFRAPFLVFTPDQRAVLNSNGFLYDSSISETYPTASSPARNEMLWPYTMDYGIPQDCGISTGVCTAQERHPGLWEFPMWTIQDSKTNAILASMDPQVSGAEGWAAGEEGWFIPLERPCSRLAPMSPWFAAFCDPDRSSEPSAHRATSTSCTRQSWTLA